MPSKPVLLIILVALAIAARAVVFYPNNNLSPDAIDYLNIGRNLAEGHGFTQSIKWHFFTDAPVVQSAAAERPPLFPPLVRL
ncbi:TPA: hypothetical protein DDW35_02630, partial [Candidatus Sumerlaeota bacterium]|nr:hypothetical protein [Candidatus Sumerlaeota bacterium]